MALCEATAYYKEKGYTLWDQMINIYKKYGFYKELTISITREGVTGAEEIKQMMGKMRIKRLSRFILQSHILQNKRKDIIITKDYKRNGSVFFHLFSVTGIR